ncbi:hypothetical protein ACOSP7_032567 [Xanthoceras sorbifolium]
MEMVKRRLGAISSHFLEGQAQMVVKTSGDLVSSGLFAVVLFPHEVLLQANMIHSNPSLNFKTKFLSFYLGVVDHSLLLVIASPNQPFLTDNYIYHFTGPKKLELYMVLVCSSSIGFGSFLWLKILARVRL